MLSKICLASEVWYGNTIPWAPMILSKGVNNNIVTRPKSLSQTVDCPAGGGRGGGQYEMWKKVMRSRKQARKKIDSVHPNVTCHIKVLFQNPVCKWYQFTLSINVLVELKIVICNRLARPLFPNSIRHDMRATGINHQPPSSTGAGRGDVRELQRLYDALRAGFTLKKSLSKSITSNSRH